jgi:hypothetical protein
MNRTERAKFHAALAFLRSHGTSVSAALAFHAGPSAAESSPHRRGRMPRWYVATRPRKADLPRCGARCRSKAGAPCAAPVATMWMLYEDGTFAVRYVELAESEDGTWRAVVVGLPRTKRQVRVIRRQPIEGGVLLLIASRRCRMHGGQSIGPKTAEGRRLAAEAAGRGRAERWRRWRAAHPDARKSRRTAGGE